MNLNNNCLLTTLQHVVKLILLYPLVKFLQSCEFMWSYGQGTWCLKPTSDPTDKLTIKNYKNLAFLEFFGLQEANK